MDKTARAMLLDLNDKTSAALDTRMHFDDQSMTNPITAAEFRAQAERSMVTEDERKAGAKPIRKYEICVQKRKYFCDRDLYQNFW